MVQARAEARCAQMAPLVAHFVLRQRGGSQTCLERRHHPAAGQEVETLRQRSASYTHRQILDFAAQLRVLFGERLGTA
jgi:hypothetical protein